MAGALAALAGATRGQAQGFAAPVLVPASSQPVFVATADVNGDGIPDLIYIDAGATASTSTTHVLLGDGKGGFRPSATLTTAGIAVAAGNLLGKGKIDIGWITSVQNASGSFATWHVAGGVGDGTFEATATDGPQISLSSLAALPVWSFMKAVDGKGQANTVPSIAAVDTANGYLFAFPIESSGLLATSTQLVKGPGPIVIGDVNGDTYDDFLVDGESTLTLDTLLGSPSNTGTEFTQVANGYFTGANGVQSLALADFNGDGKLDMAAEDKAGRIDVFAGNGDGTFQSSSIGGTMSGNDTQGDGGYLIAATDLNGDGIPDLLAFSPLGVSVELGTASGNFNYTGSYTAGTGAGANQQFVTADFNGDGVLDVAIDAPGGIAILYGKAASGSGACTAPAGTVVACPEPSAFEGAFTLSATVPAGSSPGGTVAFSIAGSQSYETQSASLGTATVVNGVATLMVVGKPLSGAPIIPGAYAVTGSYVAAPGDPAVNLPGTHTILLDPTTVTLTPAPPSITLGPTYFYGQGVNGYVNFNTLDSAYPATGSWTQLSNGIPVPGCIGLSVTAAGGSECPYGYPTLLDAGSYVFTEAYNGGPANGDPINASSVSAGYAFTITPDITSASALTSSMNPAPVGTAVTFTVTLMGNAAVPTGMVQFLDGTNLIGTATLNAAGQASLTTSALSVGTHPITAVYAATLDFKGVTSAVLNQVITAASLTSAVTLTSSVNPSLLGQPVTFTAAASVPGPFPFLVQSGTITFLDGATPIGTGAVDQFGRATLTTATLALGSHAITASYPGGKSPGGEAIAPSVSAVLTQVVDAGIRSAPPGFSLTVTPNPVTLKPGNTGTELVTVQAISGFSQAVALSCTGTNSSNELGCAFVEGTIPVGGGSTTLNLTTTAPFPCGGSPTQPYGAKGEATLASSCGAGAPAAGKVRVSGWRAVGIGGAMVAGLVWIWPKRRRRWARLMALAMLAGGAGLSGCGNCTNLGTRPGNYQITVSATGGNVTQSVVVKIEVLDP